MADRALQSFVRECLARGSSRDDISQGLRSAGWPESEIQEALESFVDAGLPLATWATALGSLLFEFINIRFSLMDGRPTVDFGSIRFGVAAVIVAFPVFGLTLRRVKKDITANPARGMNPVRRWLSYIALFVAATILVGDAIGTVMSFLNGELTIRFILKAAVIASLAGGVTWWLLRELRDKTTTLHLAWYAVCVVVATTIGVAAWVTGGPLQARLEAQDEERVRDLRTIYQSVNQYYQQQKRLPATLEECDSNPRTFITDKNDPVTGQPYGYQITDADTFTLKAAFNLPSRNDRDSGYSRTAGREEFWKHEAGETTFTIDIGPPNE